MDSCSYPPLEAKCCEQLRWGAVGESRLCQETLGFVRRCYETYGLAKFLHAKKATTDGSSLLPHYRHLVTVSGSLVRSYIAVSWVVQPFSSVTTAVRTEAVVLRLYPASLAYMGTSTNVPNLCNCTSYLPFQCSGST